MSQDEIETLKQEKEDRRSFKLEDTLTSNKIIILRQAIMNFIVGACMRRIQQEKKAEKQKKYSFIIHVEKRKKIHTWQTTIVKKIRDLLIESAAFDRELLDQLIKNSYCNLAKSLNVMGLEVPEFNEVHKRVYESLTYLKITTVNSEPEAKQSLDENGQLKLSTPYNIFIGGQILDRGLTIENLIGFYYGRKPN